MENLDNFNGDSNLCLIMSSSSRNIVTFEGCNYLRQRLILSILSGKAIKIKKIRYKDDNPGLREFESSLLSLLDDITKGTTVIISHSGTSLYYDPGMLYGGDVEHNCNLQRSIGYYLEVLLCLAPFTKQMLRATLTGVTSDQIDPSVDIIKGSALPVLKRFLGTDDGLEIKINKRGVAPLGGGEVVFSCPTRQKLRPVQFIDAGKVRRIRGIAWAVNVSPLMCNKMVESARHILNRCLPDVYIFTDHRKRDQSGRSPGFGITLAAETTGGSLLCAEACSRPYGSTEERVSADDVGAKAAFNLLAEIYKGGCVDSVAQALSCVLMALGEQDVSKLQTGPLSDYTVQYLRHIRDFFGLVYKIDVRQPSFGSDNVLQEDDLMMGGDKVMLTCSGVGFRNLSKVVL